MPRRAVIAVGILLVAGVISLIVANGFFAAKYEVHSMRIEYTEMPADDRPLEDWIKSQRGVRRVAVARAGDVLSVTYEVDVTAKPLDIAVKCRSLGYAGEGSSFEGMQDKW